MSTENKKEKTKVVELKVKPTHPAQKFRLGKHTIGVIYAKYELNEAELKELDTAGPKAWLIVKKDEPKKEEPKA